jgi:hypothetical protein
LLKPWWIGWGAWIATQLTSGVPLHSYGFLMACSKIDLPMNSMAMFQNVPESFLYVYRVNIINLDVSI